MDVYEKMKACGVVPVVVIEDERDAVPTAEALLAGGIDVMEITFRTAAAEASIRAVAKNVPAMCVGAGTVLTKAQAEAAKAAGASFIVSPGLDEELVRWCLEQGTPAIPGCVTPTELMQARKLGLRILKFFPANVYGGLAALKALAAPFPDLRFLPTGGVNAANLAEYLAAPSVFAVGGSWLCAKKDIREHNFQKITALCTEAKAARLQAETEARA